MAKPKFSTYIANATGWVGGKRVKEGAELQLTARQARYENVRAKGADKPAAKDASKK